MEEVVPYEACTGRKADISHLQVFGSLRWAHLPEPVCEGKLESRAVMVQMLGWWTDEMKRYWLEDLENGKLIASQDIHFLEDDIPSDLAVVEINQPQVPSQQIDSVIVRPARS